MHQLIFNSLTNSTFNKFELRNTQFFTITESLMGCNKSKHASVASGNTMKMPHKRPVTAINKRNDSLKRSNIAPVVMAEIPNSYREERVGVTKDAEVENVEKSEYHFETSSDVEAEVKAKKMDDLVAKIEVQSFIKNEDEVRNAEKKALVEVERVENVDEEKEKGVDGDKDVPANHLADENGGDGEGLEEAVANAAIHAVDTFAEKVTPEAVDVEVETASEHENKETVPAVVAVEKCIVAEEEEKELALEDEAEKCDDLPTVEAVVEVSVVDTQIDEKDGLADETEEADKEEVTPEAMKQEDEVRVATVVVVVEEKTEKCDDILSVEAIVEVSTDEVQLDEKDGSASKGEEPNEDNAAEEVSAVKASEQPEEEVFIDEKNGASTAGGQDELGIVAGQNVAEKCNESIEASAIVEEPEVADVVAGAEAEIETGAEIVVAGVNDVV